MIHPNGQLREFMKGEPISSPNFRRKLNQLVAYAKQQNLGPGTFQNKLFRLQYPTKTSGQASSSLRWGRVYAEISASTAFGEMGDGTVTFETDGEVDVENPLPEFFVVGAVVWCDFSYTPPLVVSGSCRTIPAPA